MITARRRRVNSLTRLRYAVSIGCHSVDGTYLAYGPDRNLPVLLGWLSAIHTPAPAQPGTRRAAALPSSAMGRAPLPETAGQDDPVADHAAPMRRTGAGSPVPVTQFEWTLGDPTS